MKIQHALLAALGAATLFSCSSSVPAQSQTTPKTPAPARDFVWFEAESASQTNFPPSSSFSPQNETEAGVLSGGKWMSAEGDRANPLFLEYKINVPQNGKYNFYTRKFWHHGPFRFKWDDTPWRDVRAHSLLDGESLRQYVGANWVGLGEIALSKGAHTLRVELLENKGAAAFDAWLLSPRAFVPRGKLQPGQKYGRANPGHFAWEPDEDTFKTSAIDLRRLNERFAGENGFIRTRGEAFVHGKTGREVRFWAINSGGDVVNLDPASMRLMARTLAKSGVNMVRYHGGVWKGANWREPDLAHIQKLREFVRVLKSEGIYTSLSIYFPLWLKPDATLAGYNGDKNPFSSLFFNPDFQEVYRGWWSAVMLARDSTGLALKDDPAVAICELVNEDSHLFWTFNSDNVPAPQLAILQTQFGDFLKTKYGSLDAAFEKWGGGKIAGDAPESGRAAFRPLWELFNDKNQRSQDTATFLTLNQKQFFEGSRDFLRGLGFKSAIYGSNWQTADARVLGPLDKFSNTAMGTMDRHGYFSGPHEGPAASYSISNGDKYADRSALLLRNAKEQPDFELPIHDLRYNDLPSIITEIAWTPPNRLRADFPLLVAAYGALQGSDGAFFFASAAPSWDQTHGKFSIRTPVVQGQFPAAALIYRLGLVRPAAKVADISLATPDLFALKGAPVSAPANLDELRKADIPAGKTQSVERVETLDPRAFLVGKVGVRFSEKAGPSQLADLSRFINDKAEVVTSQTGELSWDYGEGVVSINAPQAQAVTGFLSHAGVVKLRDVTFSSDLDYGALALVSLDGLPLSRSKRMLLQAMSEEIPFGWQTKSAEGGLQEITNLGSAPLSVKQLSGSVSLGRTDADTLRVTALDANGYPVRVVGAARSLKLSPSTLYYLIEAR